MTIGWFTYLGINKILSISCEHIGDKNGTLSHKGATRLRSGSSSMFLGHRHTTMLQVQNLTHKIQIWVWDTQQKLLKTKEYSKLHSHVPFKNLKSKKRSDHSFKHSSVKGFLAALKLCWFPPLPHHGTENSEKLLEIHRLELHQVYPWDTLIYFYK